MKPGCVGDDDLLQFHAGELAPARAAAVEVHLRACAECASRDQALRARHEAVLATVRDVEGGAGAPAHADAETVEAVTAESPSAPSGAPLIPGYQIVRELSRGGQGVVYQAVQKSTKRKVAIKVLLDGACASPAVRRRFEREVELIAQLRHPNIVAIFDSGVTRDGRQFCVMDYIRGEPLNRHVCERQTPLEDLLRLFAQTCDAVQFAHHRGIVHRDLKPSNILVDADGQPKVLDFGLAKQLGIADRSLISMTGEVVGTLRYLSPEQARGSPHELDTRTDVYSLGVILYELLTGTHPYPVAGDIGDVLRHIKETEPTPPSRAWIAGKGVRSLARRGLRRRFGSAVRRPAKNSPIDNDLETIVLRMLAKDRTRRYPTAAAAAQDVRSYLAGEPIEARRDSRWYVLRKAAGRLRKHSALAAALIVALAGVSTAAWLWQRHRERVDAAADMERAAMPDRLAQAMLNLDLAELDRLIVRSGELGAPPELAPAYRGFYNLLHFDLGGGAAMADEALRIDPGMWVAHFVHASVAALRSDALAAGANLTRALRTCPPGNIVSDAAHASVLTLLREYDRALEIIRSYERRKGAKGLIWIDCYARWFRLLRDPPIDLRERMSIAELVEAKFDSASLEYGGQIPFVSDARADVHIRLALLHHALGQTAKSQACVRACREDSDHLVSLGAPGCANRHLSEISMWCGNLEESARYADLAYAELTRAGRPRVAINDLGALDQVASMRAWSAFARGDRAALARLMQELSAVSPRFADGFEAGFLAWYTLSPEEIDELDAYGSAAQMSRAYGIWAGACWTGHRELAAQLAGRLVDAPGEWPAALGGFIRDEIAFDALLSAAQPEVSRIELAWFTAAMIAETESERRSCLESVLLLCHPDAPAMCTYWLLASLGEPPVRAACP